nr:hypothetical protein GCM10020093_011020 [Planobispora longispora]
MAAQLRIAAGARLRDLGLEGHLDPSLPPPAASAVQLRVTMESLSPDGRVSVSGGTLRAFEPPGGPACGWTPSPAPGSLPGWASTPCWPSWSSPAPAPTSRRCCAGRRGR